MPPTEPERAPEGVVLQGPHDQPIRCLLLYKGREPGPDGVVDVWEVMPERIPEGFGQEPGWTVKVAVMPPHSAIRLCLPGDQIWGFIPPSMVEGE